MISEEPLALRKQLIKARVDISVWVQELKEHAIGGSKVFLHTGLEPAGLMSGRLLRKVGGMGGFGVAS